MAKRRRGGWLGWLVGLVVLLALLWVGYWYAARYAAETAIARLNSGPVGGATVSCAAPTLGGFPLTLDVRCERVTASTAAGQIEANLGTVSATAPLYWPGEVNAVLASPLSLAAPAMGVDATTTWRDANARVVAGLAGLRGFGASFTQPSAENRGTGAGLPLASATAATANGSILPSSENGNSYVVRAGAAGLVLTRTDGAAFPEMDAETRLTLENVGPSLGNDPAQTIRAWARDGGTLKIDRLRLAGVGALITADGSLRLSGNGLLNGGVVLRWNSIAALADFIEALVPGSRQRAELPLQGINAVSVPVDTADGKMNQTALTFTDGRVWLGIFPLPLDPIPPITF